MINVWNHWHRMELGLYVPQWLPWYFSNKEEKLNVAGCSVSFWRNTKTVILMFLSWSGRHTCWGQPFRLCHVTTGRYLGLTEEKGLHLVDRVKADINTTSFCFQSLKVSTLTWNPKLDCCYQCKMLQFMDWRHDHKCSAVQFSSLSV